MDAQTVTSDSARATASRPGRSDNGRTQGKGIAAATRGINREYMGPYVHLSMDVQHRSLEPIVRRYDAFDGSMQYVFGFVPNHIRKPALVKKWGDDMEEFLNSALAWMAPLIASFETELIEKNYQHAQVRTPKPFQLGSQSPYSTLLVKVLESADRLLMLLDSLWLYRLTEQDHKNSVQNACIKLLGNILNEGRNLHTAARRELDEHNRKLSDKKAAAEKEMNDVPPSALLAPISAVTQ